MKRSNHARGELNARPALEQLSRTYRIWATSVAIAVVCEAQRLGGSDALPGGSQTHAPCYTQSGFVMQSPCSQCRHGSPTTGGQSAFDWHVSACAGEHVTWPSARQAQAQIPGWKHSGKTHGFAGTTQSASCWHDGGVEGAVVLVVGALVVVVVDVVLLVGQGRPRGWARHRRTNFAGGAPGAGMVRRSLLPTATASEWSTHATSPHTRSANVQTPSHAASTSQR